MHRWTFVLKLPEREHLTRAEDAAEHETQAQAQAQAPLGAHHATRGAARGTLPRAILLESVLEEEASASMCDGFVHLHTSTLKFTGDQEASKLPHRGVIEASAKLASANLEGMIGFIRHKQPPQFAQIWNRSFQRTVHRSIQPLPLAPAPAYKLVGESVARPFCEAI